jgi:hypothetical protein
VRLLERHDHKTANSTAPALSAIPVYVSNSQLRARESLGQHRRVTDLHRGCREGLDEGDEPGRVASTYSITDSSLKRSMF